MFALLLLASFVTVCLSESGIVELDNVSFDKLVGGKFGTLVAFVEYGWKTPENFKDVGDAFANNKEVLVAKLDTSNVKDEDKPRFKPSTLPTLRWYASGSTTGVDFSGNADEPNDVIEFVQFQLKPELKELKNLAATFMNEKSTRKTTMDKVQQLVAGLEEQYKRTGQFYSVIMKRVSEKGDDFVAKEQVRVKKLIDSKSVSADKIKDFKRRLAALDAFVVA